jgi:hypothetical protein
MSAQPTPDPSPAKTGALRHIGEHKLGLAWYHYWRCVDCGSDYAAGRCNGHEIGLCPWCRPDSKPWTNGRGL